MNERINKYLNQYTHTFHPFVSESHVYLLRLPFAIYGFEFAICQSKQKLFAYISALSKCALSMQFHNFYLNIQCYNYKTHPYTTEQTQVQQTNRKL